MLTNTNSLSFITNPSSPIIKDAMRLRKVRNELINSNIANIDTPFYKAKDLRFEGHLQAKVEETFGNPTTKKLQLVHTRPQHLDAKSSISSSATKLFFRDGHMVRNDGNTVDLDVETTEMSKNSSAYKALAALSKKQGGLFTYAIESSAKLS